MVVRAARGASNIAAARFIVPNIGGRMSVAVASSPYINGDRKRGRIGHEHRVRPGIWRTDLYRKWSDDGVRRVAEIGVADGRNSLAICEAISQVELLCVDPWMRYDGNPRGGPQSQHVGNYDLARQRLAGHRVTFVMNFSMEAVRAVPYDSLDAVYIDGHHSFDWVMQDLIEWSKRVRPGGWVAGHDMYDFKYAGVVDAVVAYTNAHGIDDWSMTDEREPSFWWVKP